MLLKNILRFLLAQMCTQTPLINDAQIQIIPIPQPRRKEGLEQKPSSYIDALNRLRSIRPLLVQTRNVLVRPCRVVPCTIQAHYVQSADLFVGEGSVKIESVVPALVG